MSELITHHDNTPVRKQESSGTGLGAGVRKILLLREEEPMCVYMESCTQFNNKIVPMAADIFSK